MSEAEDLKRVTTIIHSVFIYAAFTDAGYVKVGMSRTPFERIYAVHISSPSPVRAAQWVWIGSLNVARQIERDVRSEWRARNTRGEWYYFDYSKPEEKREFHDTLSAIVEVRIGRAPEWEKLGPEKVGDLIRAGHERNEARKKPRVNPLRHVPR